MSPGPLRPVAILGVGAAAPALRLAAADVGGAWGSGGGRGSVAVCDADEDTLTLAWQAASAALGAAGVSARDVSGLWWGTARPPFAEGPSHGFLATTLGLDRAIEGALVSGSPHAGMEAVLGAWDALAAGHARVALVVASDALVPGLGTAGETTTGAGAAALVLGAIADTSDSPSTNGSSPAARLLVRTTRSTPAVDRYRADGDGATTDVYDARLFREEFLVPLLTETGRAVAEEAGSPLGAWAVADPDGKLAAAVAKRLGAPLVSAPVYAALGDIGAAGALLGLIHGCADSASGTRAATSGTRAATPGNRAATGPSAPSGSTRFLGMIGYGGGRATAIVVEVLRPVPGAVSVDRLGAGRREASSSPWTTPSPWACRPGAPPSSGVTRRCWGCSGRAARSAGRSRHHPRSTPPAPGAEAPGWRSWRWRVGGGCRRSW
jgi:hydroxymethylglutaryl-CoA synthase